MCAVPWNGTRWCSQVEYIGMSLTSTSSSWFSAKVVARVFVGILDQPGKGLGVPAGDPSRGVLQAGTIWVLTHGVQKLADGRLRSDDVELLCHHPSEPLNRTLF